MKKKDPDYLIKLERAISDKFGPEAITNPRSTWDDEKEAFREKQIKKWQAKQDDMEYKNEKIEQDGFFISKKLLNKEAIVRTCPICAEYSFNIKDDVYMAKHNCCFKCHTGIQLMNKIALKNKESQSWTGKLKRIKNLIMKHLSQQIRRLFSFLHR